MAVLLELDAPGLSMDDYERLRGIVHWDTDPPPGLRFHCSAFDDAGAHVVDLWDSQEECDRFFETRLAEGMQQAGIDFRPDVRFYDTHAILEPHGAVAA